MQTMLYEYIDQKFNKLTSLGNKENSRVWLAQDVETGRIVVKKYISSADVGIYECLKSIHHKNLVPILYTAQGSRDTIVIMEYISGQTIEERLETQGIFSKQDALDHMIQLLGGLSAVHKRGIIHRDINPCNLMISTDGVLKILDFDIGRMYKTDQGRDTQILGTAGYAAPEQFGFLQSDGRADIYASGILMNVLLTGKEPIEQICTDEEINRIIQKCIQIDPEKRYQSADELLEELERIQASRMHGRETETGKEPGAELQEREPKRAGTEEAAGAVLPEKQPPGCQAAALRSSIWPGFRTGVWWKKLIAVLYYVNMGIYSAGCIYDFRAEPMGIVLGTAAIFIYIWLAALLPLNFLGWMEKVPVVWRMGRVQRIIAGVVIWLVLFLAGVELEEYTAVNILHIPPLTKS